jgi:hypothetical protein
MKRLLLLVIVMAGMLALAADKDKYSDIKIKVLKDENGKPVRNAAVVLHAVNAKGKQEGGGLNLKTNGDGETTYDGIPYGKLRIQVIAQGLQTYGNDLEITQPQHEFVVKMKPPQKQYSIYEHPGAKELSIDPDRNPDKKK